MNAFDGILDDENFNLDFNEDDDSGRYLFERNDMFKKSFKLYNFRRPDKFSKDHLKGLYDLHRDFSRQLSLSLSVYLRIPIEIDIVSVDQLTYDEFIRSMPIPISIGIFELKPLNGQVLLSIGVEVLSSIVDRMLGGIGSYNDVNRELTDIEESLTKRLMEKNILTLEKVWSKVIPVTSKLVGMDKDYSTIQIVTPSEIVALITFEIQISGKYYGLMSLCFTYPFLENILSQLTTQHIYQTSGLIASNEDQCKMVKKLDTTNVNINVLFGKTNITLREFLSLKEGDVIKLNEKTGDESIVLINNERKFFARPGKIKNKVCIKITDVYDESVDILKSYE